jgi:4-amino-4-deoxy-L-arabinose transferase-like glycosyltransferase
MASIQDLVHRFEQKGGRGMRMLFVVLLVGLLLVCYNWRAFRNMNTQEAMDAAQVARNLAEGHGFATDFIRPFSIHLVQAHNKTRLTDTNSEARPDFAQLKGLHPDLANPPVYPLVLAGAMKVLPFNYTVNLSDPFWSKAAMRPTPERPRDFWRFQPDFLIALLNQTILIGVAILTFFLARRLFDSAVAWMAFALVLCCEVLWHFSVTGLSTMLLLLIFMGLVWCLVWMESEERDPVWSHRAQTWLALGIGLLLGLGTLTRYSFGWLVIPVVVYLGIFCVLRRWRIILLVLGVFLLVLTPWIWRNLQVSGTPFGTSGYALVEGTYTLSEHRLQRSLEPDFRGVGLMPLIYKLLGNTREIISNTLPRLGGSWASALFLTGLLLSFRSLALRRLRYFLLAALLVLVITQALGRTQLSDDMPDFNSENLLVLLVPLVFIYGVGLFFQLLEQMNLKIRELRYLVIGLFAALINLPMALALISPQVRPISYPPYYPPAIQDVAQYLRTNELMTSDIPWAVAWYGNRQCLWLPRNATDQFYAVNDYMKPVRCLYLTPLTTDSRILSDWVRAGADRSWPIFILESLLRGSVPAKFPLKYAQAGYFPEQLILWDYIRWTEGATPTAAPPESDSEPDKPAGTNAPIAVPAL